MARDPRAYAEAKHHQVEDIDPFSEETRERVRWVVASFATDADDATELMLALGVHPSQSGEETYQVGLNPSNPASQAACGPSRQPAWMRTAPASFD